MRRQDLTTMSEDTFEHGIARWVTEQHTNTGQKICIVSAPLEMPPLAQMDCIRSAWPCATTHEREHLRSNALARVAYPSIL